MSVSVIYCEGNSGSYDIRLLRQILPKCEIKPLGGKSFMEKIIPDRLFRPNLAGIVDRDFDNYDITPQNSPLPYTYQGVQIGWKWERKEIENYLIDPEVVKRTVRNKISSMNSYQEALEQAAQEIAVYTAARAALTSCGFQNCWGERITGVYGSTYSFPRSSTENAIRENIRSIVDQKRGDRIVSAENVLNQFEELLPLFKPGGDKFENYLTFFAGKDLLWKMQHKLEEFGFEPTVKGVNSPIPIFLDKIMARIEREEEVYTWLPEWEALRNIIINTTF
ncbi:MAG: DUF4435 domain-containing protein [Sphaerospermopsis sp. SIO1G2]|nr:DUF4435 domain-containing protein [Sphaerospermopsis sp. SIO1G2]